MFAASFAFVDIKKVDEEVMVTIKPERSIFSKLCKRQNVATTPTNIARVRYHF